MVFTGGAAEPTSLQIDLGDDTRLLAPSREEDRAWLGRRGELWQIDLGAGEVVGKIRLPADIQPRAVAEDLAGRLWVGTERGLLISDPRGQVFALPSSSESGKQGQRWTWICGQRRIGKTSLLRRLEAESQEQGWVPLFLNLAHIRKDKVCGDALFDKLLTANRRGSLRPYKLRDGRRHRDLGRSADRGGQRVAGPDR